MSIFLIFYFLCARFHFFLFWRRCFSRFGHQCCSFFKWFVAWFGFDVEKSFRVLFRRLTLQSDANFFQKFFFISLVLEKSQSWLLQSINIVLSFCSRLTESRSMLLAINFFILLDFKLLFTN